MARPQGPQECRQAKKPEKECHRNQENEDIHPTDPSSRGPGAH
jgi:hypothetical protein